MLGFQQMSRRAGRRQERRAAVGPVMVAELTGQTFNVFDKDVPLLKPRTFHHHCVHNRSRPGQHRQPRAEHELHLRTASSPCALALSSSFCSPSCCGRRRSHATYPNLADLCGSSARPVSCCGLARWPSLNLPAIQPRATDASKWSEYSIDRSFAPVRTRRLHRTVPGRCRPG